MVATNIPTSDGVGMASFTTEQFTQVEVFAGDTPAWWTSPETVDATLIAAAALPIFSVVGRNAAGNLVLADPSLGTPVLPIGITTALVLQNSVNKTVAIFRAGAFNIDALNWSAYYNTDLLKRRAFEAGYAAAAFNLKKPDYSGVYF